MQKSDGERQVLKKQARTARANHLVRSSMEPGERKTRRKPVLELFVDGAYTENTEDWQKEPQKHCESVYVDPEETKEVQQKRIKLFKMRRDRHFSEDGRAVEISVDLVLQARAKLRSNKVSGFADAVVSEMIRKFTWFRNVSCIRAELFNYFS